MEATAIATPAPIKLVPRPLTDAEEKVAIEIANIEQRLANLANECNAVSEFDDVRDRWCLYGMRNDPEALESFINSYEMIARFVAELSDQQRTAVVSFIELTDRDCSAKRAAMGYISSTVDGITLPQSGNQLRALIEPALAESRISQRVLAARQAERWPLERRAKELRKHRKELRRAARVLQKAVAS